MRLSDFSFLFNNIFFSLLFQFITIDKALMGSGNSFDGSVFVRTASAAQFAVKGLPAGMTVASAGTQASKERKRVRLRSMCEKPR